MTFGRSNRSKRSWFGAERAPGQAHPHQRTESTPSAHPQPWYAAPAGACSVNTLPVTAHPASPVAYYPPNVAAASAVQLASPPPAPLPQPPFAGAVPGNPPPPVWCSRPSPSLEAPKWKSYSSLNLSASNLVSQTAGKAHATVLELDHLVRQSVSGDVDVHDATSRLLDQVITSMDRGSFCGRETELVAACSLAFRSDGRKRSRRSHRPGKKNPPLPVDFSKVYLYANSRMPPGLPPLKLYLPTYPLLRLAARYSRRVYDKPSARERHSYVDADWRQGTKAMVIKSLPVDDMSTIIFAIRGTQSFLDWAVNVHMAPTSPAGFLDDPSNCCHAGFLSVARKMVAPVAARLRFLLEEDPTRMSYSLLITGHSAGGAVASLLYLHLLSESPAVRSELTHLRGCFKHIHCVTFGAPPVSLRPLTYIPASRRSKSMFFAFVNEGDPVARADKDYFFSLLDLYVSPAPGSLLAFRDRTGTPIPAVWRVPHCTLSAAGRLVLLRTRGPVNDYPAIVPPSHPGGRPALPPREDVEACVTSDAELRGAIFGDPVMHLMDLYARRIDALARSALGEK